MTKRIIGLTGGIATGKTTVANYLANAYNLPILDADIYARDAVAVGSPILSAIAQRYGQQILLPDGNLNRQHLGEIIFDHPDERKWVESLIHPYVGDRFNQAIAQSHSSTLVLVIPLLFEAQMTNLVTEIWVVHCSNSQQLQRLIHRNQLNPEQAQTRINSQLSITEKVARADIVLDNSSTPEALLKQVDVALTMKSSS
ncbi:dephospho-CoA kinase [Nostocales cyanobacterium LEGE 11386]|nr:dephospho-CoA kinase [Nostocales cyanobacterium LEGE 11386]